MNFLGGFKTSPSGLGPQQFRGIEVAEPGSVDLFNLRVVAAEMGSLAATFDVTVTSGIGELDYTRAQVLRAARTSIEFVAARTPTNDHLVLSGGPDDILLRGGLTRRLVLDSSILDVEGTPIVRAAR